MSKFGFKKRVKSLFNVGRWIGVQSIRENGRLIRSLFHVVVQKPDRPTEVRSFEEAVEHFQLDEASIENRQTHFKHMSWIYGIIFFFGIAYDAYLIWRGQWGPIIMMTSFNFMIFAFFFRESFWYLQMRERQLGLTFKDWWKRI